MKNSVFQLWQMVEALTPVDAARVNPSDSKMPVYGVAIDGYMPWNNQQHQRKKIESGWRWLYAAQCGIYSVDVVTSALVKSLKATEKPWMERTGGKSRLFDLSFDHDGLPMPQTFAISLAAWAGGQLLISGGDLKALLDGGADNLKGLPVPEASLPSVDSGFKAFDALSGALMQLIEDELARFKEEGVAPGVSWIGTLVELVTARLGLPPSAIQWEDFIHVKSLRVKERKADQVAPLVPEKSEILTSFFVEDLRRVEEAYSSGRAGAGLKQFMSAGGGKRSERLDVRNEENLSALFETVQPEAFPVGRWPSDHALVFSQQVAVNEALGQLSAGAGLFSVNGPPGTGKTTLLRDVVAAVVVQRAAALVRTGRTEHFAEKKLLKLSGVTIPYYPLHDSLQGYSIVLASSNNGAVENVSKELPGVAAVPDRVLAQSTYFPQIATKVLKKPAWGLLAAPLGNKQNRSEFLSSFWWGENPQAQVDPENPSTFRDLLRSLLQGSAAPAKSWTEAVRDFKDAFKSEAQIRAKIEGLAKLPEQIEHISIRLKSDEVVLDQAIARKRECELNARAANSKLIPAIGDYARSQQRLVQTNKNKLAHQATKPSLWDWITTLGRASREWSDQMKALSLEDAAACVELEEMRALTEQLRQQAKDMDSAHKAAELRVREYDDAYERTLENLESLEAQLDSAMQDFGASWPDPEASQSQRELTSPWLHQEWLNAREEVFLAALALHRAFAEAHPAQMMANLGLVSDWLNGKQLPPELTRLALDSLCLVVPVVSSTFASIPRMFANMGPQAIGWLLIDEGGQATPSHAACAIWRARRTVVVGDPLQLEPVSTMPVVLETELARILDVGDAWLPSQVSAQSLADQSAILGTYLVDDAGAETWVGCPLRLHRRCDQPMFAISNAIAYGGMMVHGKSALGRLDLPESTWFDVRGEGGEGHWVPEEGAKLIRLLRDVTASVDPGQVAMISPFRDCARELRRIAQDVGLDLGKVGTVHTAQGKEAEVVIMVLGGNPKLPGAKAWAASKPNLLNVAVSRAKARLYVIGDRQAWSRLAHFSTAAEMMPSVTDSASFA